VLLLLLTGGVLAYDSSLNLCNVNGVTLDAVTKDICTNSQDVCEAYIKKGTLNGVNVQTCSQYCAAIELQCVEMYDDQNSCNRGSKYESCEETGGGTSDHICVCGPTSAAGILVDVGNPPGRQLGNCEGDCDDDSDCEIGYMCLQTSDMVAVSGCTGTTSLHWDYCIPDCVFLLNTENDNELECVDGNVCDGAQDGWDCCSSHGNRAKCPPNFPTMCSDPTGCGNGTSYCCSNSGCTSRKRSGPRVCQANVCCAAFTVECISCQLGLTVEDFCVSSPSTPGCTPEEEEG